MDLQKHEQLFYEHWKDLKAEPANDRLSVGEYVVMHAWEAPLMKEFARLLTVSRGDVLEIGFGMGLSATYIQEYGAASHTIIEPHPQVIAAAEDWRAQFSSKIILIDDIWQNRIDRLLRYDAILFDPVHAPGCQEADREAFIELAATKLLRSGGRLIMWHKGNSYPESYQRFILRHFSQIQLSVVKCGPPPEHLARKGYPSEMIVPLATL